MKRNFKFVNCGNIVQIFPLTKRALKWIRENLQTESWQWLGNSLCVGYRYAQDIYDLAAQEF